ncbi:hypothetical protein [Winogradskyella haliclonae]|uniref:Uncharacterized protein n=1 Tax=Winogradskyella haliclonae TaxID=2048558 RepID=A0ABQ2BXF4_9FLAO|nr:hypothetical protein [Winogradskyella haliclonae]GGI57150.1 hypothetical protein GCM10011444_14590 [Winogradskyella haliclonae]
MKTIYILLVSLYLLTNTQTVLVQSNSMPDFTIQCSQSTINGDAVNVSSTFSKTGNTITWTQTTNTNSMTAQFAIVETSGSWDSATSNGDISFVVTSNDYSETIRIIGDSDDLSLTMNENTTDASSTSASEILFNISSISYQ